ncbi:hypothetical protein ACSVC9_00760 [Clostridium sp. LBM24168]
MNIFYPLSYLTLTVNQDLIFVFNDTDLALSSDTTYATPTVQIIDLATGLPVTLTGVTALAPTVNHDAANGDNITLNEAAASKLTAGHKYRISISGAKDKQGNVMAPFSINVTTGTGATLSVDVDGPSDNSAAGYADGSDGANTVLTTAKVRVTPSAEIDTTTVTADTAYIKDASGNKVAADITFDGANNTVVNNGVVQDGDTGVLKLDFDKNLDSTTVTPDNVKLHDDTANSYVTLLQGNLAVTDGDGIGALTTNRVEIRPLAKLTAGHVYTITATGLTGTGTPAETMASNVTRTFAVQQDALTISGSDTDSILKNAATSQLTVKSGSTDVTSSATFSASNAKASVNASGLVTASTGDGTVDITASYNGNSVTKTFTIDNTAPTATITADKSVAKIGTTVTFTSVFNEALVGTPGFTLSSGTAASITNTTGNTYTFTANNLAGNSPITAALTTATDAAGNTVSASGISTGVTADNTEPTTINASTNSSISASGTLTLTADESLSAASWTAILNQIKTNTGGSNWITGVSAADLAATPADGTTLVITNNFSNEATLASDFVITAANVTDIAGNSASGDITIDVTP